MTYKRNVPTYLVLALGLTQLLCSPMTPERENLHSPTLGSLRSGEVFIGQPIRFSLEGDDADGDSLNYSFTGLTEDAFLDPHSGFFRWRPGIEDTGSHILAFYATDGQFRCTTSVRLTVVVPQLESGYAIKILLPPRGSNYLYGDTVTVGFCMISCGKAATVGVTDGLALSGFERRCVVNDSDWLTLSDDSVTESDADTRYFEPIDGTNLNVGYLRFPLNDRTIDASSCAVELGSGVQDRNGIRVHVRDPSATSSSCSPETCADCDPFAWSQLAVGVSSAPFNVLAQTE